MNATKTKLTKRWSIVCTGGYCPSLQAVTPNPAAHGGYCYCEARIGPNGTRQGRITNANGRHSEVGPVFALSDELLARWES